MPRLPAAGSVTASSTATDAERPDVMNVLVPLTTQRSPRRTARVRRFARSEPACGSVKSRHASSSPPATGRR